MHKNKRTLTEVSFFSVQIRDAHLLREMKGHVSANNPLRVHRCAKGFIISLEIFHNGDSDAPGLLRGLGLSDDLIATLSNAAEMGADYLEVNNTAPRELRSKSYFELSTSHLRVDDGDLLANIGRRELSSYPFIIHSTVHGWIIDLGELHKPETVKELGFSEQFKAIVTRALEAGATIIEFEVDADYEPGLPIYDQETDEDITEEIESVCRM